jgi:hypothetical protein
MNSIFLRKSSLRGICFFAKKINIILRIYLINVLDYLLRLSFFIIFVKTTINEQMKLTFTINYEYLCIFHVKNQKQINNLSFRIYVTDFVILFNLFSSFVCKTRQAIHGLPYLSTKKNMSIFLALVLFVKKCPVLLKCC